MSYETASGNTTYYTRCSCGLLVNERLPGGSKDYYLFDGLGSIVGLTNSNSSEVNAYDPYGNLSLATTGVTNPWQYAGGYFESSTGFVKFGTRYYNPVWGRWTQQDLVAGSLGSPDSLNRYLYARDNPVNVVDTSRRYSTLDLFIACVEGAVGGAIGLVISAFTPFILGTGPIGLISGTGLLLAIAFGCAVATLGYNLEQLLRGIF